MANIPRMDFRGNKFVNPDGTLTEVAQGFFDLLDTVLTKNIGPEALVAPSQSSTTTPNNIATIQNNKIVSNTNQTTYTCQFGTFLFDTATDNLLVAKGSLTGIPIFKTVMTT